MRPSEEIDLPKDDCSALFYSLLLKDLGCSSNAAKIAYLFGADDHRVKRSVRMIDWTKPAQGLAHYWSNGTPDGSTFEKVMKMAAIVRSGSKGGRKISEIRCERGADIARKLLLPDATAEAIRNLDEHWNGRGTPQGLKGEQISLLGRLCCLAQTVEVFFSTCGLSSAMEVAQQRRGKWFDPYLVDALASFQNETSFWSRLYSSDLIGEISQWEPEDTILFADDACLYRIAEAFAAVVDAKSPWTYQHSTRVADSAVGMAKEFGCPPEMIRDLRRAALLHDIGKLGVPNLVLDKPGKTDRRRIPADSSAN